MSSKETGAAPGESNGGRPDQPEHRFQVDLRGLIDLLSQHLYSGPSVFVRELLQNGVDAIEARCAIDADHEGFIELEVISGGENGVPTLMFRDNGIGLTENEAHEFLATIGMSSKRGALTSRGEGFLGQFGIGLLSCFLVSDEIVVISKSAREPQAPTVEWKGLADGTYAVRTIDRDMEPGTQIYLRAKPSGVEWMQVDRIEELCKRYGRYLHHKVELTSNGRTEALNEVPLWQHDTSDDYERQFIMETGQKLFERQFFDVFPLRSHQGDVEGLAFVLGRAAHSGHAQAHRAYLKNMLLSEKVQNLLPDWAFFVQCVVNVKDLRPTASRESFYEDEKFEAAREQLGGCLRQYLMDLSRQDPVRLQEFIAIHDTSIKALAVDDDECLRIFANWLPFETSAGTMTLGQYRQKHPVIRYVSTRDQFRQISQVAAAESFDVINAGYVYDTQLLNRLAEVEDVSIEPFDAEELSDRFAPLNEKQRDEIADFEALADEVLRPFRCAAEVVRFMPHEIPALFITNESADFLRSVEASRDESDELWSGILSGIAQEAATTSYARLHLNYDNSLIRRVAVMQAADAQRRCVELLYIQSLLMGHFPLRSREVGLLNSGLLGLIDWATAPAANKTPEARGENESDQDKSDPSGEPSDG